jgi:hypothetical protein
VRKPCSVPSEDFGQFSDCLIYKLPRKIKSKYCISNENVRTLQFNWLIFTLFGDIDLSLQDDDDNDYDDDKPIKVIYLTACNKNEMSV